MDGSLPIRCLILVASLLAIESSGCRHFDMADPGGILPFQREPRTDKVPGLATPAERMAVLRKLADRASQASPAEQEKISKDLSVAIRKEADPSLRAEIVRTLSYYPTKSASLTLRSALNDSEANVRIAACNAWGRRGGPEAIEILSGVVFGDVDSDVRLTAVRALGQTADPKAKAALGHALANPDPAMQRRAMLALKEVTGEDFGGDAGKWRAYLDGQMPERDNSIWVVERLRGIWGRF